MTKKIPLTKSKFALVDDEDFEYLSQKKWYYSGRYAVGTDRTGDHPKPLQMHRVINKTPAGLDTDHCNGDGLDNRKANLRTATRQQNLMNAGSRPGSSSQYKGVSFYKAYKKWMASGSNDGKMKFLGYFITEIEAAKAYNNHARENHGEFAKLNDIPEKAVK